MAEPGLIPVSGAGGGVGGVGGKVVVLLRQRGRAVRQLAALGLQLRQCHDHQLRRHTLERPDP